MSNGHDHNHHHQFQSSQARLRLAFWTQLGFFVVELVGGILSNSLALLADAGHMLSDVAALGLSLLALRWTLRRPTAQKTFGYHRLEILVALINGLVLWAMAGYIFYEAISRIFQPPEISSTPLLVIASLGLAINLLGMYILLPTRERGINLRSAFIHLLSDSLGETADAVARAVVAQFMPGSFRLERLPKVSSVEQLRELVNAHCGEHCIFFYTIIEHDLLAEMRSLVSAGRVRGVDILGPGVDLLASIAHVGPRGVAGAIRQADEAYYDRIEAMEFAIKHDDGQHPEAGTTLTMLS